MKSIFSFMLLFACSHAFANVRSFSASEGAVEFVAIGKPSFIKIHGKGTPAHGTLQLDGGKTRGEFDFELTTLATGIETRDDHMKNKYLEVGKFPRAHLEIESAQIDDGWTLTHPLLKEKEFRGQLTLHGVTRPTSGQFSINDQHEVEAQFKVKLKDYQIDIPSFAGITVSDEVEVHVKFGKVEEEGKKTL